MHSKRVCVWVCVESTHACVVCDVCMRLTHFGSFIFSNGFWACVALHRSLGKWLCVAIDLTFTAGATHFETRDTHPHTGYTRERESTVNFCIDQRIRFTFTANMYLNKHVNTWQCQHTRRFLLAFCGMYWYNYIRRVGPVTHSSRAKRHPQNTSCRYCLRFAFVLWANVCDRTFVQQSQPQRMFEHVWHTCIHIVLQF